MKIHRESYPDLIKRLRSETRTSEDVDNMGEWFSLYGYMFWDGECYDCDEFEIFPVNRYDPIEGEIFFTGHYSLNRNDSIIGMVTD